MTRKESPPNQEISEEEEIEKIKNLPPLEAIKFSIKEGYNCQLHYAPYNWRDSETTVTIAKINLKFFGKEKIIRSIPLTELLLEFEPSVQSWIDDIKREAGKLEETYSKIGEAFMAKWRKIVESHTFGGPSKEETGWMVIHRDAISEAIQEIVATAVSFRDEVCTNYFNGKPLNLEEVTKLGQKAMTRFHKIEEILVKEAAEFEVNLPSLPYR